MKKLWFLPIIFVFMGFYSGIPGGWVDFLRDFRASKRIEKEALVFNPQYTQGKLSDEGLLGKKTEVEIAQFKQYVPILMFHYIQNVSPDAPGYNLSFSPERLEQFLQFFQAHDITPITFHDLKQMQEGTKVAPENPVILTFDDGHLDHYTNAFRLLEQYDTKGVFFIIATKPDVDPHHATWDQVKEIAAAGHEIGSHTMTHQDLRFLNPEQLEYELGESKRVLEECVGTPVISLCYPAGRYNQAVLESVGRFYEFARTTQPGKVYSYQTRYETPTTRIFPQSGLTGLKIWFQIDSGA